MDDFDFSIGDFDLSNSGVEDLLPSEFAIDSNDTEMVDYLKFQGSDSLDLFGGAADVGSKVLESIWGGAKAIGSAYSGLGSDTKWAISSAALGGAQAWLQSRNSDKEREYLSQMKKEDFDRLQNARRIPADVQVATAARFK